MYTLKDTTKIIHAVDERNDLCNVVSWVDALRTDSMAEINVSVLVNAPCNLR